MHSKTRIAPVVLAVALSACMAHKRPMAEGRPQEEIIRPVPQRAGDESPKQMVRALFTAFRHGDDGKQTKAAAELEKIEDAALVPILLDELEGSHPDASFLAAKALVRMGDRRATPYLLGLLGGDRAFDAILMLGALRDERALPALRRMLESDDPALRAASAESLGEMRDSSSVKLLLPLMKDRDSGVRGRAAKALGELRDGEAALPLVVALMDREQHVRAAAIGAIGQLGEPAIPLLFEALQFGDPLYKLEALESLIAVGSKAVPSLIEALEYGDADLRSYAVRALGNIKDRKASPALIKALDDVDGHVRGSAANALRMMREESALPRLREVAKEDLNGFVRAASEEAIRSISGR